MIEVLFLLLPIAAASGWWLARREMRTKRDALSPTHPDFLRGLNYLLEEQPDKAIDMFSRLTEVNGETVETHLALGSLFRRRGEVDRAIRIHQNLIARKNLGPELRGFALFELGQDYMRAGLLDRAECLFGELVELGLHRKRALYSLLDIYQQERDWPRCLEVAEQIKPLTDRPVAIEIAHYHCEIAEDARRRGNHADAHRHLVLAQESDPDCVRAVMLEGRAALEDGEPERAFELLRRLADRHADYVPEILPLLTAALSRSGQEDLLGLLETLALGHASPALMRRLSEEIERAQGPEAALDRLTDYLAGYADLSVLERLLELQTEGAGEGARSRRRTRVALEVTRHLWARQPVYQCEQCGFQARSRHWQCPSCKRWGTLLPVRPEPIVGDEVSP